MPRGRLLRLTVLALSLAACSATPASDGAMIGGLDPDTINQLPASKPLQIDGVVPRDYLIGPDAAMCGRPVIERFMGGLPGTVPARYRAISPQVSPPRVARALLVIGVLPAPPEAVTASLRKAGAIVEVIAPTSPSHFDLIAPGTANFAAIEPALLRTVSGR